MKTDPTSKGAFFWEGLDDGRILLPQCERCGKCRHPQGLRCSTCDQWDHRIVEASGRGALHSYTVIYRRSQSVGPIPLTVGLVELDEGVRLLGGLDELREEPRIGMALVARFGATEQTPIPLRFVPDREARK